MDEKLNLNNLTTEEVVKLFDPANAQTLPVEALSLMPQLTEAHIKSLAEAYPNKPTGNAYLILKDTKPNFKQLYPRSTWANLEGIRTQGGLKTMVALTFTTRFQGTEVSRTSNLTSAPVQDLTEDKAALPGLKVAPIQEAKPVKAEAQKTTQSPVVKEADKEEEFPDLSKEAAKMNDENKIKVAKK